MYLDSDGATGQGSAEAVSSTSRSHFRVWAVLIVMTVAIAGGTIGLSLGSRQSGPLVGHVGDGGRLVIVVPTLDSEPAFNALEPLPSPSPVPSSVVADASPEPATVANQYIVQPGDTLRSIALDQYGDAELWQMIYQANRSTVGPNPDALVAGKTLQIPVRR
jgi:hypothetical protein